MKRVLSLAVALALAMLVGGTAVAQMRQAPRGPMGPGQITEQMAKMMESMTQMHEQMKQMQEQMKGMQDMGPMQGRMGSMMSMMGQMHQMMTRHQEMMKQLCPGAMGGEAPKQGG